MHVVTDAQVSLKDRRGGQVLHGVRVVGEVLEVEGDDLETKVTSVEGLPEWASELSPENEERLVVALEDEFARQWDREQALPAQVLREMRQVLHTVQIALQKDGEPPPYERIGGLEWALKQTAERLTKLERLANEVLKGRAA